MRLLPRVAGSNFQPRLFEIELAEDSIHGLVGKAAVVAHL
jgi:hypothetical protein